MSEYMFGCGDGHRSGVVAKIAKRRGATLCNYVDASCKCGCGCAPHTCKASKRHWFSAPNQGEPFNQQLANEVMLAVNSLR